MAIYIVTSTNWNSAAFWASISESTGGHTLDATALGSTFQLSFDEASGLITITNGGSVFTIGESGASGTSATLGAGTRLSFFDRVLTGSGGNTLSGGSGNDSLVGGAGADLIAGGTENDTLEGGSGADVLYGGDGNDSLFGGNDFAFSDTLYGGAGNDFLDTQQSSHGFAYGGADADTILVASDHLITTIEGGEDGDDRDRLSFANFGAQQDGATITFTGDEQGTVDFGTNSVNFIEIEEISASSFADTIDASADGSGLWIDGREGADDIRGGSGADEIFGGTGNDTLQGGGAGDTVTGDQGDDLIYGDSAPVQIVASEDFTGGATGWTGGVSGGTTSSSAGLGEFLGRFGGDGQTSGTGTPIQKTFDLAPGMNAAIIEFDLYVIDSWDRDVAGFSNPSGDGFQIYINGNLIASELFSFSDPTSFEDRTGTVTFGNTTYTFSFINTASGELGFGGFTDHIWRVRVEVDNPTSDALTLGFAATTNQEIEDESFGIDNLVILSADDTQATVAQALAPAGADQLSGGEGSDTLFGNAGDDTLLGEAGSDVLFGQSGNDSIVGGIDQDLLFGGDGADVLLGESGGDSLYGGAGSDSLFGGDGNDLIYGDDSTEPIPTPDARGLIDWGTATYGTPYTVSAGDQTVGVTIDLPVNGAGQSFFTGNELLGSGATTTDPIVANVAFDQEVMNVRFEIWDVDAETGIWDDRFTIIALDADGNQVPVSFSGLFLHTVDGNTIEGAGNFSSGVEGSGAEDSVWVDIAGPIVSLQIISTNGDSAANAGVAYIDDIAFSTVSYLPPETGGSGADIIDAGMGDDIVYGGDGDDSLTGGEGADTLYGGAGQELITAGLGDDVIYGGEGSDTIGIGGFDGNDTVFGGEDASGTDNDLLDLYAVAPGQSLTVTFTGDEAGSFTFAGSGATGTFAEIETINLSAEADALDASAATQSVTVFAGAGDDTLIGGSGGDFLAGGFGSDSFYGGSGDTILGGEGGSDNDTLFLSFADVTEITYGGGTNESGSVLFNDGGTLSFSEIEAIVFADAVDGTSGNDSMGVGFTDAQGDQIDGTDGPRDVIFAGAGNDTINPGIGNDLVYAGDGFDIIQFSPNFGNDTVDGGDSFDWLDFTGAGAQGGITAVWSGDTSGDVTAAGGTVAFDGIESIIATADADYFDASASMLDGLQIFAGDGNDTILGSSGDDNINAGFSSGSAEDNDLVFAGAGNDFVESGAGDDTLFGGAGNDEFDGGLGQNRLFGGDGNDALFVGDGNSTLWGDAGNDTLRGENGQNQLYGGDGDDRLIGTATQPTDFTLMDGGAGADTIDGSLGNWDIASYFNSDAAVVVDLTDGLSETGGHAQGDILIGIEQVDGSNLHNDTIIGNDSGMTLRGWGGDDSLIGGSGNDMLLGDAGNDTFLVSDNFGHDTIQGGFDYDTLDLSGLSRPVVVVFTGPGAGTITDAVSGGTITFSQIEQLILTPFDDQVDAALDAGYTYIQTRDGNDLVQGSAGDDIYDDEIFVPNGQGNDTFFGGDGNDSLWVGTDDDLAFGGNGNDSIEGQEGNDTLFGDAGDDILRGMSGDDVLAGGSGNDGLFGGADRDQFLLEDDFGADTIFGGESGNDFDVIDAGAMFQELTITLTGTEQGIVNSGANSAEFLGIEGLSLSSQADALDATAATGSIVAAGAGGDDTLTGGSGNDMLLGDGRFTNLIQNGSFEIVDGMTVTSWGFRGDASTAPGGWYTGAGGVIDVHHTGAGEPTDGSNWLDMEGSPGFDTVSQAVQGVIYGQTYTLSFDAIDVIGNNAVNIYWGGDLIATLTPGSTAPEAFSFIVTGGAGDGSNILTFENVGPIDMSGVAIDNVQLLGFSSLDAASGFDVLDGGAGDDTLIGGGGDDVLFAGLGNDRLDSGTGVDTAVFQGDVTEYSFDYGPDGTLIVTDLVADRDGQDTLSGFEFVIFDGETYHLVTGDDGANTTLQGPNDSTPSLIIAHDGNDWGGGHSTSDVVFGGTGDDTLDGGAGHDTLLGEDGNDLLRGDEGEDSLIGAAGNDTLQGGAGDDTLDGGADDDSLIGGAGSDMAFGGDGNDFINTRMTFGLGSPDRGYPGAFPADSDPNNDRDTVFGGAGNDTVLAGDDNDLIFGGDGADSLDAGFDDDTVHGDGGNDTIIGGEGRDLIYGGDDDDLIYGDAFAGHPENFDLTDADGSDLRPDNSLDTLYGGTGNDIIYGGDDADLLFGGEDDDQLSGGVDNDTLQGDAGNDTLFGDQGDDQLFGGDGADVLDGGIGSDTQSGGAGDDTFRVGSGDTAFGGAGNDRFFVTPAMLNGAALFIDGGEDDETFGDTLNITGPANIVYDNNPENGTVTWLDGSTLTFQNIETINYVPCFTEQTLIKTRRGEVPAAQLRLGDMVLTRNHGYQPIRWIGTRQLDGTQLEMNPALNPVVIRAGALGVNTPERDLIVSPQHRVLIGGGRAQLWFGEDEVFVAADNLTCLNGVEKLRPETVTYVHIMFDRHQIVSSDGAWTESYQPGDMTLGDMDEAQRRELFAIFPELFDGKAGQRYPAARVTLRKHEVPLLFA